MTADNKQKAKPYFHAPYDVADAAAIQAVTEGRGTEDQQKRAMKWIVDVASATYGLSFIPQEQDSTAFAEGRRFVGLQIIKLYKLNLRAIKEKKNV